MERNAKKRLIITFIVCYGCYLSNYLIRQTLSVSGVTMIKEGIMDAVQLGILGNVFFWVYAAGRFLTSSLGDRYSPHIVLGTGMIVMSVSVFLFSRFFGFGFEVAFWALNAFSQAVLWGAVLRAMQGVTSKENRRTVMAVLTTCIGGGTLLAIVICPLLESIGGVQLSFTVAAVYTVVGAVAFMLLPTTHYPTNKESAGLGKAFFRLMKDKKVRENLLPAVIQGILKDNVIYWMSFYFVDRFAIDLKGSTWFVILIPALGIVGRLLSPALISLFGNSERKTMSVCFVGCILGTIPVLVIPAGTGSVIWPLLAAVGLGLVTFLVNVINQILLAYVPMHYGKEGLSSTVSGIMDLFAYFGAGFGSLAYGFLLKYLDYSWMFLSWVVLAGAAAAYILLRKRAADKTVPT